jgi:lysozyme family protein
MAERATKLTTDQLFQRLLSFVLRPDHEGEYSDRPGDPGGKTMRGITEAVARKWGWTGPMQLLPMDLTVKIYREGYFDLCHCGELPPAIAALVFDSAVNQGGGRCLQRALNSMALGIGLVVDGAIGPKTLAAVKMVSPDRIVEFADMVAAKRAEMYHEAKDPKTGERMAEKNPGWWARLMRCHTLALELARQS